MAWKSGERESEKEIASLSSPTTISQVLVYGDEGKLRQILMNLLSNAVKFTESGHVTLWGFLHIPRKRIFRGSSNQKVHRSRMNNGIYVGLFCPLFMRLLPHMNQKRTDMRLRK